MMRVNPRNIFLLDGIGACVSALLLGLILPKLPEFSAFPSQVFYSLAAIAFCLSFYSMSCYWLVKKTKPGLLLMIALGNTSYCGLTAFILLIYDDLSNWGRAYFLLEIALIIGLAMYEFKIYLQLDRSKKLLN